MNTSEVTKLITLRQLATIIRELVIKDKQLSKLYLLKDFMEYANLQPDDALDAKVLYQKLKDYFPDESINRSLDYDIILGFMMYEAGIKVKRIKFGIKKEKKNEVS